MLYEVITSGDASKSGIVEVLLRNFCENLEAKAVVGGLDPAPARKLSRG